MRGALELDESAQMQGAALDPTGQSLAAVYSDGETNAICHWDFKSSAKQTSFEFAPLPHDAFRYEYEYVLPITSVLASRHAHHLLFRNELLIDMEKPAVVWRYQFPSSTLPLESCDGRNWALMPIDPGAEGREYPGSAMIVMADMPSQVVRDMTKDVTPASQCLLCPGMKVRLSVNVTVPNQPKDVNVKIAERIIAVLKANGITVDPSAPVQLAYSATEEAAGNEMLQVSRYSNYKIGRSYPDLGMDMLNRGPSQSFQRKRIVGHDRLSVRGSELWRKEITNVAMRNYGQGHPTNTEDLLLQEMYQQFTASLKSLRPPAFAFRFDSNDGTGKFTRSRCTVKVGESFLTAEGDVSVRSAAQVMAGNGLGRSNPTVSNPSFADPGQTLRP